MVGGLIRMMDTPTDITGPINLGNPHEIAVSELAQIILRLTGSKSRIVFRPLPKDDPTQRCPDINLARTHLDWKPTVGLEAGCGEPSTISARPCRPDATPVSRFPVADAVRRPCFNPPYRCTLAVAPLADTRRC